MVDILRNGMGNGKYEETLFAQPKALEKWINYDSVKFQGHITTNKHVARQRVKSDSSMAQFPY